MREAISIGETCGIHVQIAHLKLSGTESWGGAQRLLEEIEVARRRGVRVDCDQYPYTTATNPLRNLLPMWVQDGGIPAMLERLREPAIRARMRTEISMNADHWLGTDQLGRDLLTRLIYGARVSLYVGFGAVALGALIATSIGILSAYFGGRVDLLLQRAVDAWMAFPPLLLLMSIMSLVGPGVWNITAVLGVAFGIQNSRIIRGVALSVKEYTYIEGARAVGAGHVRITGGHILPNVLPTIIVIATTGLSTVILTEASLSFLGLGVPPPYPTWGGMLSLAGLDHMYEAPWLAIWPAVALSLAVFGFNMLGDALRDLLDPRLKGG